MYHVLNLQSRLTNKIHKDSIYISSSCKCLKGIYSKSNETNNVTFPYLICNFNTKLVTTFSFYLIQPFTNVFLLADVKST